MRWACILLPQLALDAVLRQRPDPEAPLAVVTGPAQRRVLAAVNAAARTAGLQPGQSLTAAHALTRDFEVVDGAAADSTHWHRFLAAWAYGYSSQVSLQYPRVLMLEIGASLGLFGPWPRFEARLRDDLVALGFQHRIVAAPHPAAARALVNIHDGLALPTEAVMHRALSQMPVDRVGLGREEATAFIRMGLRTLGQVMALPRASLARRFSVDMLQHLDALVGARDVPLAWYTPPDSFDVRIELGFEVEAHTALLFPLKRLTADLGAFLAGRDGGVQQFALHLAHADQGDSVIRVGLLSAERDPAMLFEVARGRLEQLQLPAPVRSLRLIAKELPAFVPAHRDLFDMRPQEALSWEPLRERLRARLGDDAVHGLRAQADHRPERAWLADSDRHEERQPRRVIAPAGSSHSPCPFERLRFVFWPVRSVSNRAGGTAAMCAVTITWSRRRWANTHGCIAPPASVVLSCSTAGSR